jgi:hypothetical protein
MSARCDLLVPTTTPLVPFIASGVCPPTPAAKEKPRIRAASSFFIG